MASLFESEDESFVAHTDDDSLELNSVDLETSLPRPQTRLLLRTQNDLVEKPQLNPEEQIIKARGRRQLPKTPTRRSPRKRITSTTTKSTGQTNGTNNDSVDLDRSLEASPICSPFTKCLRGLMSPPRPTRPPVSNLHKRLMLSPPGSLDYASSHKRLHYYSPISRSLRSGDSVCLEDSGFIDHSASSSNGSSSFDSSLSLSSGSRNRPSSTTSASTTIATTTATSRSSTSTSSLSGSSSKQGIIRARRRFRF